MLRVYGYGLDAVDEVELVSPTGQIRSSRSLQHDDAWLVTTMDLSVADPGTWGARFLANAELVLAVDRLIDVLPFAVYAFKDPWVSTAREVDLVLAETGWSPEYALQLVHAEDESRAPLEVVDALQPDTLRVSVDLTGMPEGIYDLEVSGPGLKAMRVAGVLYLGDPPVVRVPEDHSTISAAIAQAPAGARIEIAAGDYHEAIRIDRPLQIASAGEPLRARLLPPDGVEARVIHVLETAGRITRLEGLRIESGRPAEGSGGGVLAETPITVADCRLYNNWVAGNGSGGGAFLAPGSQVLRSQFIANLAPGVEDQWVAIPFGANGTAGGLYCEHCRVDRNHIRGNQAGCSGGAVVSGLFRENEVGRNTSRAFRGHIDELSVQGDVIGNHFENSCGVAYPPSVCIFGPSRAAYNTFTDYWWDMCSYLSLIQLQGPVEFTHNSLAGVGLQVCTQTQQVDLGPKNQILVHDNLILFDPYDATPPWIGYCDQRLGPGPVQSVDLSRISAGCNLGSPFPIYSPSGEIPCPDCVYPIDPGFCEVRYTDGYDSFGEFNLRLRPDSPALPGHSPIGCADTLGALPAGCEEVPVLVSGARLARTEAGVELRWWTLQDIDLDGFHVFRHSAEESVRLTNDPLAPCGSVSFSTTKPWLCQVSSRTSS
ncbi:MAG: hypothetical protein R3E12_04240 [Candidatus Eisenbacteria bacterium]